MATALLRRAMPQQQIASAGLAACVGEPADRWALKLMRESGIDISAHRGRQVTQEMLGKADLVLVMEAVQQRQIEAFYPAGRGKISRLCHFSGQDVLDPYGRGEWVFRCALQVIESGVKEWTDRLTRLTHKQLVRDVA